MITRRLLRSVLPIALLLPFAAIAQPHGPELRELPAWAGSTDRIIVKYRDEAPGLASARTLAENASRRTGLALGHMRRLHNGVHVFKLPRAEELGAVQALVARLQQDPTVLYAEPDYRMFALHVPNDPRYAEQWHYQAGAGGARLPAAWDKSRGEGVVVAVIDTGGLPHADLADRLLPGYDFIADAANANDGDGRDADASDPGDWATAGECGSGYPSRDTPSSWHGTHVAGTIAAAGDNGLGVSGVAPRAFILPARVLGKCGGYSSDIIDAVRWSAGLAVPGVPANAHPARVLNLSLGGSGLCGTTYRNTIAEVRAAGAAVVVAAGNAATNAYYSTPANCAGVIAVAATDRNGGLAYYSNYGTTIDLSAPGGELSESDVSGGILSTYNGGQSVAGADSYAFLMGTSMAAPHVAGVAALLFSLRPDLTADQLEAVLKGSARRFPATGSDACTTSRCGAGIVDAAAAVAALVGGGGGTGGWECREHLASNVAHVTAGRATLTWGLVYAKGSQAYLGFYNYFNSTRLAETEEGRFQLGSCP